MSYLRALWLTETTAAFLLLLCATMIAAVSAVSTGPNSVFEPKDAAVIVFLYALIIVYALLRSRGRHRIWLAVLIGSIPAAAITALEPPLAPFAIGAALVVSIGTHLIVGTVKE